MDKIIEQMSLAFGQDVSMLSLSECTPDNISGWDSLSFLNLIALLEESFNLSFEIEDIAFMSSGGEAIFKCVVGKTGK